MMNPSDIVLPPPSTFEVSIYEFIFPSTYGINPKMLQMMSVSSVLFANKMLMMAYSITIFFVLNFLCKKSKQVS